MGSLSRQEQERAIREAVLAWHLKNKEGASEEQIAERLGYGIEALRKQFKNRGMPDWILHGTPSQREEETEPSQQLREDGRAAEASGNPKNMTFGEAEPLPLAIKAAPIFRATLKQLLRGIELLDEPEEYLQSRRFVGTSTKGGNKRFFGVAAAPSELLTTLIAVQALVSGRAGAGFMVELIDALHPGEAAKEVREPFRGTTARGKKLDPEQVRGCADRRVANMSNKGRAAV